jgi:acid phosphatase type 7
MSSMRSATTRVYLRLIAGALCICVGILYVAAVRGPAAAASPNLVWAPYLQRLADGSMAILWTTHSGTRSAVWYSPDASYSAAAEGRTRALGALGTQLHRVVLGGLQPDTVYHYKVFTDNEDLLPDRTLAFRTAPSAGGTSRFTFIAFGDYGISSPSQARLRNQMLRDSFDFILTTGDNAYPDATYADFDARVFQVYRNVFSTGPVYTTIGNREYRTDGGAPYLDLFELPANVLRPADAERYYSFDYGNAHIVSLDSNAPLDDDDGAAADDMLDWLRTDLGQTMQRWKIVTFHHPAYSAGAAGLDPRVQAKLVPILEAYGVNLVLSGHDHNYQRSQPLLGGQVTTEQAGGIVYVVSGAGEGARSACGSATWLAYARCSVSYGLYSRVTMEDTSITVEAVNDQGIVEDRYTIEQAATPPPDRTIYAADTFSRNMAEGWGSAETGGVYRLVGASSDFWVNGSAGIVTLAPRALRSADLPDVVAQDVDIIWRVSIDKLPANGGQIVYSVARRTSAGDAYLGRLRFAPDGSVRVQAIREVAGVTALLGGERVVAGLSQVVDTSIWLRTQVVGSNPTTVRLRAWADGQAEPEVWQYSIDDAEQSLQQAGSVGLRTYLSPAATNAPVAFRIDDLLVTSADVTPGS